MAGPRYFPSFIDKTNTYAVYLPGTNDHNMNISSGKAPDDFISISLFMDHQYMSELIFYLAFLSIYLACSKFNHCLFQPPCHDSADLPCGNHLKKQSSPPYKDIDCACIDALTLI